VRVCDSGRREKNVEKVVWLVVMMLAWMLNWFLSQIITNELVWAVVIQSCRYLLVKVAWIDQPKVLANTAGSTPSCPSCRPANSPSSHSFSSIWLNPTCWCWFYQSQSGCRHQEWQNMEWCMSHCQSMLTERKSSRGFRLHMWQGHDNAWNGCHWTCPSEW